MQPQCSLSGTRGPYQGSGLELSALPPKADMFGEGIDVR
jgi:hypothetical protein